MESRSSIMSENVGDDDLGGTRLFDDDDDIDVLYESLGLLPRCKIDLCGNLSIRLRKAMRAGSLVGVTPELEGRQGRDFVVLSSPLAQLSAASESVS